MSKINLPKIKIDKRQSTPINLQLTQGIKRLLMDQKIKYLTPMPPMEELAAEYDVEFKEVQICYHRLLQENFLRLENKDYVVNYLYVNPDYYLKVTRLIDVIKQLGLTPSIKTIKKKVSTLPFALAIDATINPKINYIHLKRIYYGNGIPLAIMDTYLAKDTFSGLEDDQYDEKPLYETIFNKYGRLVSSGRRILTVVNLSREDAKLLNATVDSATYQVTSVTYDQHHQIVDITRSISTVNQYFEVDFNENDIQKIIQNHFFYI